MEVEKLTLTANTVSVTNVQAEVLLSVLVALRAELDAYFVLRANSVVPSAIMERCHVLHVMARGQSLQNGSSSHFTKSAQAARGAKKLSAVDARAVV